MEIRRASAADMPSIFNMVDRVFYGEQRIPRELHPLPECKDPQWWCAEQDGEIIGMVVMYREADGWHMGRMAVTEALRGRHLGTKLLRFALKDAFGSGVEEICFEARDTTVHILKKFGAVITGEPFLFYEGTVTQGFLKREDFRDSVDL